MIRCLNTVRHVARRAGHKFGHMALHHPGRALAIVWVPCALAGAAGTVLVDHWPAIQASAEPIAVPEPTMLFVWLAAGAYVALHGRKA